MDLGLFMMPLHPPTKDRTQTFEEDTAAIVLADELGFAEAWIGQHHTAAWEPIPANDLFIASVIPQTQNLEHHAQNLEPQQQNLEPQQQNLEPQHLKLEHQGITLEPWPRSLELLAKNHEP